MRVLLFANTDWYLYNFRLSLAHHLQADGHEVILASPAGKYSAEMQRCGFRWIEVPMDRGSLNPIKELLLVGRLRDLILSEKIDVVHGFTIKCAVYAALAGRICGVKGRVGSVAGMGYVFTNNSLKASVIRPIVRLMLRLAFGGSGVRLIVQNPDDLEQFRSEGLLSPLALRLVPGSGVDCVKFRPVDHSPAEDEAPSLKVGLAARLLADKGVREYVQAAEMLAAKGCNVQFQLAGAPDPGNPSSIDAGEVGEWAEKGIIRWLGHVDDMPAFFHSVDVVVLPSYREGLPKGLIEAAACGKPLVATDVPGCREVVSDCVEGFLVPPRSAAALADAISRLAFDPILRSAMGAAARKKALNCFDENRINEMTLDVYKELLLASRKPFAGARDVGGRCLESNIKQNMRGGED